MCAPFAVVHQFEHLERVALLHLERLFRELRVYLLFDGVHREARDYRRYYARLAALVLRLEDAERRDADVDVARRAGGRGGRRDSEGRGAG